MLNSLRLSEIVRETKFCQSLTKTSWSCTLFVLSYDTMHDCEYHSNKQLYHDCVLLQLLVSAGGTMSHQLVTEAYVGGSWCVGRGDTFPVHDPATGAEIARVTDCTVGDVCAAVGKLVRNL